MPRLVKLESSSAVSNYTPASGKATIFLESSNGAIKLRAKTSSGDIVDIGGSDTSDATATASDIRSGYTAYTSTGKVTGTLVPSPFNMYKVTAYQSYRPQFTANSSIVLSGFTGDEEMGTDYSNFNDTYTITRETAGNTDWKTRVYKKQNKVWNYTYYLYYKIYDPETDYMMSGDYWAISSSVGSYPMLWYETNSDLTSGTLNWQDDMGTSPTCTATCTTTTYPEIQAAFTGRKASSYDLSTGVWTFANSDTTLTTFQRPPKIHGIYAASGTNLIGNKIMSYAGPIPTTGLVFYHPLDKAYATAPTGQTFEQTGALKFTVKDSVPCLHLEGSGQIITTANSTITGSASRTVSLWLYPTTNSQQIVFGIGSNNDYGAFYVGSDNYQAYYEWFSKGWRYENYKFDGWTHIASTWDGTTVKNYFNGTLVGSYTTFTPNTTEAPYCIGHLYNDQYYLNGYAAAARVYSRALTAEEILALAMEWA